MKQMQRVLALVVGSLVVSSYAWAFPSWMGVYGTHERHSASGNPGTYTILMNQDYFGLNAEVGVQVNGGAWSVYPMSYAGNVDGNSRWTHTPGQAYPAGATVKYYFHGYDSWGGHIYDSVNGQNYTFSIPGSSTNNGLSWTPAAILPTQPNASGVDIAAHNGSLYAVWGTRSNDYNSAVTIWVAKKLPNAAWQAPQQVTSLAGSYQTPRIAVSDSGIHLLVADYYGLFYFRSSTDGNSWDSFGGNPFIVISNAAYAELRADADNAYVVYNQYGAPENSRMFFTKLYKNDNAFSAPAFIFSNVSYKTTVYVKDLDVSGNRVALLTYAQGWYGGFVKYFLHQSADGGATWAGGEQPGQGAHLALRPATGSISYLAPDTGAGGAGLYFQSKPFDWINSWKQGYANVWAGEGTCDGLRWIDNKLIAVSQRNGLRYFSVGTVDATEVVTFGNPSLVDSDNRWAIKDVSDGVNMHLLVLQSASNNTYATTSTRSGNVIPVQWIGNTYHWPGDAELDAWDDLWINTEVFPKGAAVTGEVVYTINGTNWFSKPLNYAGATAANDQRHANLGKFAAGSVVRYALVVRDAAGVEKWDNNGGQDFRARVSNNSNVSAPLFWGLDPYRYDNEKVRVNGAAANASKSFGQFPTGTVVTVVARPVENGNGNSVQTACSIVSKLHYTTTPGNWANAVTVTGVFHAAGFSNKPIFDYYSYPIGALPPGTQVQFWMEAANASGTNYAQTAGQDFTFSIAAAQTNGDSDNDGLPDQWEMDWFQNLNQNATNNVDGDGPIGRPLANIIEWAINSQPTVPNDHTGIRLLWAPAYPQPGDTLTLSYFYGNQGNPLFGKTVYAHVGHNGWQGTFDTAALQPNGQIGRFEVQIQVPANATELNVAFHNNAGVWDNNAGQNWRIPVRPASPPSAPSAAALPASPAVSSPTISSLKATAPATQVASIKLTGAPRNLQLEAVVSVGQKKPVVLPLKSRLDGSRVTSYTLPAGFQKMTVVFRDRTGKTYGRKGQPWTFILAGNGQQDIVVPFSK